MSETRFIFDTVGYQNSANTVNNYVKIYNAQNNAAATGNGFKFKTDAERMQNLLGSKGQTRNSGYYDGLYATFYNMTFTDGTTVPSINGPGNAGWGAQLWSGPITDLVNINDEYLISRAKQDNYVAIQISGYLYSPVATTVTFQITADDGGAVIFNGVTVINGWVYQGPTTYTSATVTVNAGYNPIILRFFEGAVSCIFQFSYKLGSGPYQQLLPCNFFYNYNQL
jgi:hypothetical protein